MSEPFRLLVAAPANGPFIEAAAIAQQAGADVEVASDHARVLRRVAEQPPGLILADVASDVPRLIVALNRAGTPAPLIACGVDAPAVAAVAAIRAGARDYLPLPPDPNLIAAAIASVARAEGEAAERLVGALVGHTVDEVERALILQTLERCRGNRTSASTILGISVRTMRNKLKSFIEAGVPVAPA